MKHGELKERVYALMLSTSDGVTSSDVCHAFSVSYDQWVRAVRMLRDEGRVSVVGPAGVRARWVCNDKQRAEAMKRFAARDEERRQARLRRYRALYHANKEKHADQPDTWADEKPKVIQRGSDWKARIPSVNSVFALAKA